GVKAALGSNEGVTQRRCLSARQRGRGSGTDADFVLSSVLVLLRTAVLADIEDRAFQDGVPLRNRSSPIFEIFSDRNQIGRKTTRSIHSSGCVAVQIRTRSSATCPAGRCCGTTRRPGLRCDSTK